MFTTEDFNKYILEELKNEEKEVLNSKFCYENTIDKVLLSKLFYEKISKDKSKIKLSQETLEAFKLVFEKIDKGHKS